MYSRLEIDVTVSRFCTSIFSNANVVCAIVRAFVHPLTGPSRRVTRPVGYKFERYSAIV